MTCPRLLYQTLFASLIVLFAFSGLGISKSPKKGGSSVFAGKWAFDHFHMQSAQCRPVDAKLSTLLSGFSCKDGWVYSSDESVIAVCSATTGGQEYLIFNTKRECEDAVDLIFRKSERDEY